jgi:hypothetical protein
MLPDVFGGSPFLVGTIIAQGPDAVKNVLFWVGVVPLAGMLLLPLVVETRGRGLAES